MTVWRATDTVPDVWSAAVIRNLHPEHKLVELELDASHPDEARRQANVYRCQALYSHGGLWLDNDMVPLRPLTGEPEPWVAACGGYLEGCCMWFPEPGHPFLLAVLEGLRLLPSALLVRHMRHAQRLHPVRAEQRVLPLDAFGQPTGVDEPWAVHLWATSARRRLRYPDSHG